MEIFYTILNVLSVIVLLIFIVCLFINTKLFKQPILIELVTSSIMLVINVVGLIMQFYIGKSFISTVALIFLWIIIVIYMSIEYGVTCERKASENKLKDVRKQFKKSLENILKEDSQNVSAKIAYTAHFNKPVDHTGDGFIDGEE